MDLSLSRRRLLEGVSTALTSSVVQRASGRASPSKSDWPQYRRDASNTGVAADRSAPSGELTERWSFETSGDRPPAPLAVDGTVYVGDGSGTVYALTDDDGTERWRTAVGEGVAALTASGASAVFARTKRSPAVALDAETGDERWRLDAAESTYYQPTFADGTVYAGGSGVVHAVDARSGEREWSFEANTSLVGVPAVADGTVYVTGKDTALFALDAESGAERWRHRQSQWIAAPPTVVEKRVVAADGDRVLAFDSETGTVDWTRRIVQAGTFGVAATRDTVYVGGATESGGSPNRINALSLADGASVWGSELPANPTTSPITVGDAVLVGCSDGRLHALDAATGTRRWRFEVGDDVFAPAFADGTLYLGSRRGVHAIEEGGPPWKLFGAVGVLTGLGATAAYSLRDRLR